MLAPTSAVAAYKEMPADVIQPITSLLGWLLWAVLMLCLAWLIVSAGRLWIGVRSGDIGSNDATHGVLMSLVGAILSSSATVVALALLPT